MQYMMYRWCGPARCASSVEIKTSPSFGSRTVQNWCLVSPGEATSVRTTEKSFDISVFGQSIRVIRESPGADVLTALLQLRW